MIGLNYLNRFSAKLRRMLIIIIWNGFAFIRYYYKIIRRGNCVLVDYCPIQLNYINLDFREDRKVGLENNLQQFRIFFPVRFSAINHNPGGVGCALSHLHLLLSNINRDYVCIIEDDFRLNIAENKIKALIEEFLMNPGLDVLCIGNNQMRRCVPISENIGLTTCTQTTSMYIAKKEAIPVLIKDCLKSLEMYSQSKPYGSYAIDQVWKKTQERRLSFCVPLGVVGFQEEGFSNIAMTHVKYKC